MKNVKIGGKTYRQWVDELSVLSLPLYGPEWSSLFLADLADVKDRAQEG